ncbi:MAG: hypothetical protein OCD02_11085 [Spirochaetaceae bacterium]
MSKNHEEHALNNPTPYEGNIKTSNEEHSIVEAANNNDLNPILKRYGDWCVTNMVLNVLKYNIR